MWLIYSLLVVLNRENKENEPIIMSVSLNVGNKKKELHVCNSFLYI